MPGDELHLGAEYVFLGSAPMAALRLGLAFKRFQLDLGVDLSEFVDTASLSTIYSF